MRCTRCTRCTRCRKCSGRQPVPSAASLLAELRASGAEDRRDLGPGPRHRCHGAIATPHPRRSTSRTQRISWRISGKSALRCMRGLCARVTLAFSVVRRTLRVHRRWLRHQVYYRRACRVQQALERAWAQHLAHSWARHSRASRRSLRWQLLRLRWRLLRRLPGQRRQRHRHCCHIRRRGCAGSRPRRCYRWHHTHFLRVWPRLLRLLLPCKVPQPRQHQRSHHQWLRRHKIH